MLFLSHVVREKNDIVYFIYMHISVFFGGAVIFPQKKDCLEDDSSSIQCFLVFKVYQNKLSRSPKQACLRHLHIYPLRFGGLNIHPNMDPKKIDSFRQGIFLSTLGIFVGRCSDLWVFVGRHDPPHSAEVMVVTTSSRYTPRFPDGFCNLGNSPKGEEDDAQKNEQHLSSGLFWLKVSWEHFTCGRRRWLPGLLRNYRTEAIKYRSVIFYSKAGKLTM